MGTRHDTIGVKQVIPYKWIQKTARLQLAGVSARNIRQELHTALDTAGKQGQSGERSAWTRTFLVNNLMSIWPSPAIELVSFRDRAMHALRDQPDQEFAIHWAMISAVYPFWFNTARQTGRLLNLQLQATQAQIVSRLKEQYGDRQTVSRYARFVVRSFVDWGVLVDTTAPGHYQKADAISVIDHNLASLLLYAALIATPGGKAPLNELMANPAFFPFSLPTISGESLMGDSPTFKLVRYGIDEVFLSLEG